MIHSVFLSILLIGGILAGSALLTAETAQAGSQAVASSSSWFDKADSLAAKGDLDGALTEIKSVVDKNPNSSLAHQRLGGIHLVRGQHRDAIESFRNAIGLDEHNGRAFIGMGMSYIHMGSYTLARASLQEALKRQPELTKEINKVIAWLDKRESGTGGMGMAGMMGGPHQQAAMGKPNDGIHGADDSQDLGNVMQRHSPSKH